MSHNYSFSFADKPLLPLAERMRPKTLCEFFGQEHLTGTGGILSHEQSAFPFSMILWGPPGCGKTTLARIVANTKCHQVDELSAVSSGVKELRNIIDKGEQLTLCGHSKCLIIDEIHRFNKAQQDALLQAVEMGTITLIGTTTESPSFEVISPLLSRCQVLTLHPLDEKHLNAILERAIEHDVHIAKHFPQKNFRILTNNARKELLRLSGHDARKMLNSMEICLNQQRQATPPGPIHSAMVRKSMQAHQIYDKKGDYHFDTISAFIKSVRGSCPDAALYWLATMLIGGEKPEFIARRLVILASEDIGNAEPQGLSVAIAALEAVHSIGMPEAAITLAQATTYLASAPKSNASYTAIKKALAYVGKFPSRPVPLHLRNAVCGLGRSLNYGKDYVYPHAHKNHFVQADYFPQGVKEKFYLPTSEGKEAWIREHLAKLWTNE